MDFASAIMNNELGYIFDIKQFAVFDGPGIRQTVFFKGCPLRCSWCHNPEGLQMEPQLMISRASCLHCGACENACDHEKCVACGKCVQLCPLRLRKICGESVSVEELVRRLRENADYYRTYGGGVTFSGGEPLLQGSFLLEVLAQIPDMHTCIETSGYADPQLFRRVVEQLDYVLMDVKIFDEAMHRKYTGVSNGVILENVRQLCEMDKPFVIRIPLIPGVNDNEKNLRQTAAWIAGAKHLEKVELLPYHKTAGAKYEMIGREYRPNFDVHQLVYTPQHVFQEYGIRSGVL